MGLDKIKIYRFISETTNEECEAVIEMEYKMKRISLSWFHVLIVVATFIFTFAKGQVEPDYIVPSPILLGGGLGSQTEPKPEIIAYQLVPGQDNYCHFEIQIIDAFGWTGIPEAQRFETKEIVEDRIVFEETNPWAVNEIFYIDERGYFLLRVPFQGYEW